MTMPTPRLRAAVVVKKPALHTCEQRPRHTVSASPSQNQITLPTRIIRLDIERSQAILLPIAILRQCLLISEDRDNRKCPEPVVGELVAPHGRLHGIGASALDLGAELAVEEVDEACGDGLGTLRHWVEGYGGLVFEEGFARTEEGGA